MIEGCPQPSARSAVTIIASGNWSARPRASRRPYASGVPRSTARGWLTATATPVVTLNGADQDAIGLRQEVIALRLRVDRLVALLRLMTLLLKLSGFSFARVRLPDGAAKARLLQAIDRSRSHFTLRRAPHCGRIPHKIPRLE